jgi:hypothetical protein
VLGQRLARTIEHCGGRAALLLVERRLVAIQAQPT